MSYGDSFKAIQIEIRIKIKCVIRFWKHILYAKINNLLCTNLFFQIIYKLD